MHPSLYNIRDVSSRYDKKQSTTPDLQASDVTDLLRDWLVIGYSTEKHMPMPWVEVSASTFGTHTTRARDKAHLNVYGY